MLGIAALDPNKILWKEEKTAMRICISFLSYSKDIFAGIENSIYNLVAGFKSLGIDIFIYSSYLSGESDVIDTIPIFRSKLLPRDLPEGDLSIHKCLVENNAGIRKEFCGLLKEWQVDCTITCDALWGITQVSGAWICSPCPIVLSLHVLNTVELLTQADKIPYLFRRSVSTTLRNQIMARVPLEDLIVIPNSIDTSRFSPLRNAGRTSKIIFCNARINPDKGITDLINAFAKYSKEYPAYELWLCNGDFPFGDKKSALDKVMLEIKETGLAGKVKLLPNLSWEQVPAVIRDSFVIVLPTLYESFGRAAIEALACGVPLIASSVGNIPDLVEGCAILVPPCSPEAIYKALVKLHEDPVLYSKLASQGPAIASNYDNKVVGAQFLSHITNKLNN